MSMTKKWTPDDVRTLLCTNDRAVEKGLLALFKRQTSQEREAEATREHNGKGFSRIDAEFLSSCAKGMQKYGHLTRGQMPWVRKRLMKYAGQLADIANVEEIRRALKPFHTGSPADPKDAADGERADRQFEAETVGAAIANETAVRNLQPELFDRGGL